MSPRSKIISLTVLVALLIAAGLWRLNRSHPTNLPLPSPLAQSVPPPAPVPAASEAVPSPVPAAAPVSPNVAASPANQSPSSSTPSAVPATSALPPSSPSALPTAASSEELAATARMYAAHAPLRTPAVADPDSPENKRILGTMVAKALAQPASPPPSATAAKP